MGADFFHADVFAAPQEPDFRDTIKKCVNNVADGVVPPAICSPGIRPNTTLSPSGPSGTVASGSGTFTFSTPEPDATFECRVYEVETTPGSFGDCSADGTHDVSGLGNGTYTFEVRAVEPFSSQTDLTPASRTWTVDPTAPTDTTAPTVSTITPASGATGVPRTTTVTATFSEAMDPTTLNASTFTLSKQGSASTITTMVSYDATTNKVTLKPSSTLAASTKYTVTVKAGAGGVKDKASNPLASDKVWSFTTGRK